LGLRLGFRTGLNPKQAGRTRLWIHALSVGEVQSALPFVTAFKTQYRDMDIVFTASTKTGFDMAGHLFINGKVRLVDQLGYFPLDLGYTVKKVCRQIAPDAVVIVETDVWPNFLYEMKTHQIPVILINARLSNRSLNGYLIFRKFWARVFSFFTRIMVQTPLDEKRFQRLGIDKRKIRVAGNIKFDYPFEQIDKKGEDDMRTHLGLQKETRVFIAGSTHDGEEKMLCRVYKAVKKKFPGLLMILAPRDPGRCSALQAYFLSHHVQAVLMSTPDACKEPPDIVLVDRMGELCRLYAVCDMAFIGGSLVRQGGHNPLEAAAVSKPIFFGPDMSDFLLISTLLKDHGGAKTVTSESELSHELETVLANKSLQRQMGTQNFQVFSCHSGAVQRIIKDMERLYIV
jgi:3-deoxy-D-manno-octulosonic-acid transferase